MVTFLGEKGFGGFGVFFVSRVLGGLWCFSFKALLMVFPGFVWFLLGSPRVLPGDSLLSEMLSLSFFACQAHGFKPSLVGFGW